MAKQGNKSAPAKAPAQAPAQAKSGGGSKAAAPAQSAKGAGKSSATPMQIYKQSNGNPIATTAPARPAHVQPSYVDAGSGKSYDTRFVPGAMLPGQVGYDPATGGGVWTAGGMNDEEIRAFYRSSNPLDGGDKSFIEMSGKDASAFSLDSLYGGTGTAAQATGIRGNIKDAKNAKSALRMLGADGNITKKELLQTTKQFDITGDKAIRQLDQLNAGMKSRGKSLKIGLGSNAANYLINNQQPGWAFDQMLGNSSYGDGRIGDALTKYRDAAYNDKFQLMNWDDRSKAYSAAGLIPFQRGGAYQLNSAGGYSPKVSNAAFGNKTVPINTEPSTQLPASGNQGTDMSNVAEGTVDTSPTPEQQEPTTPSSNQFGAGSNIASSAPGWRTRKGLRANAGRGAQGYASMRIAPSYASGIGTNYG